MLVYYPVKNVSNAGENEDNGVCKSIPILDDVHTTVTVCSLSALVNTSRKPSPSYISNKRIMLILNTVTGSKKIAITAMRTLHSSCSSAVATDGGRITSLLYCPPVPVSASKRSRQVECLTLKGGLEQERVVKQTIIRYGCKTMKKKNDTVMRPSFFLMVYDTCIRNAAELILRTEGHYSKYNILFFSQEYLPYKAERSLILSRELEKVNYIRFF
uniref:Uncharacterized protein n=1 Tax=Chionoecetes opilio bacilliform virus TaxID=1825681 RepID=A0A1Q3DL68_9VIRU|nr:wsv322-like protein [Chionoecetes opilio bacilliform virus]GAV93224.1 hypothetical protein SCV_104 [Chionoecetes opilio bacilliform virus]